MSLLSVALVISALVAVVALVVGSSGLAITFSIAAFLCVAGMVGTVVHPWWHKK